MLNSEASYLFLRFFAMISAFSILGSILGNLWGYYPQETKWIYLGCIYFPCEMLYWTYFYKYGHGSELKFTEKQTFMWWFILFGYSFGAFAKFFTYYNVVILFVFACASNFLMISVYWPDEKYLKNPIAIFRVVMTSLLVIGMKFISYCMKKGKTTATGQLLMFLTWSFWLLPIDYLFSKYKHGMANDLAMTVLTSRYFAAFIIGSTILVRSTNEKETESGSPTLLNVIRLTIFFAFSNAIGSSAISRFVYGNNYAAIMFGVQMYVNFSLDILFVSSDLLYADFWVVLLWTSGYHIFRNTGQVEYISEWFRIRYGSSWVHSLTHICCRCGADDVEMLKEMQHGKDAVLNRQLKAEEGTKMLLMKTQGELLQLLTPCILIIMVLVDIVCVEMGVGKGSITVGMHRSGRPYAIGVFLLTLIFKYCGIVLSREMLLSKKAKLVHQIQKIVAKGSQNSAAGDKEMDVLESGTAGAVAVRVEGVRDKLESTPLGDEGDGGFFMDQMDVTPPLAFQNKYSAEDSVLVYAERRLEITSIYLSCLLITAKSGISSRSVQPSDTVAGDNDMTEATNTKLMIQFREYVFTHWHFFVIVCGLYFVHTVMLTTQLKTDTLEDL